MLHILFWISIAIVCYTFLGYGVILYFLVRLKGLFTPNHPEPISEEWPEVSLVIPCYNEADVMRVKAENSLALDYPRSKCKIVFITDGSTDNFREVLADFPQVDILHEDRRAGKTAAENRAMTQVNSPFVVFTDANTLLNKMALKNMVRPFFPKRLAAFPERNVCSWRRKNLPVLPVKACIGNTNPF